MTKENGLGIGSEGGSYVENSVDNIEGNSRYLGSERYIARCRGGCGVNGRSNQPLRQGGIKGRCQRHIADCTTAIPGSSIYIP